KLRLANDEFRKNMDETFIIDGQWRRAGTGYNKDVVVHSTLFNSVITDYAEVEGFRDFLLPQTRLSEYMYNDLPENLTTFTTQALIDSVYAELTDLGIRVFGSSSGGTGTTGEFNLYLGKAPVPKSQPEPDEGYSGVFENMGEGETGRLLREFYFWMCKEQQGIALMAAAPWDKPMWDSRGSIIEAPTLRSAVNLALQTGLVIAGAVAAPVTAGASVVGTIALRAALNSADDLLFAVLDVSGGYKSWSEAGVEFGKQLITNTVSEGVGAVFNGIKSLGSASSFFGKGGINGLITAKGITGAAAGALSTGIQTFTAGTINSVIASVTYNDNDGFGFSGSTFMQGLKSSGINALSGTAGTFTSGTLNLGLEGFTGNLFKNGTKLSNLAGGLVSQGINYAFGGDFTLNIFNAGIFFGDKYDVSAGLAEMHLGRDGISFRLGSDGADASIGTLWSSIKGFEAWGVNAELLFSSQAAAAKYASEMRTLYTGTGVNRAEYENILAGRTLVEERSDVSWTESIFDETTGVKTIYLGTDATNDGSRFGLNVIFSHESYRNGIADGGIGQGVETINAAYGHMITENLLEASYGSGCLGGAMSAEAEAFRNAVLNNNVSLVTALLGQYDSSADYWKLTRDGTLLNDNSGWLRNEDGTYVRNADGQRIGAAGIETGLLNILFGGTSGLAYDTFSDVQIQLAQALMISAGMQYNGGADGTIRSRTWTGNKTGQALDMLDVMSQTGNTIATQVFARYYDSSIDSSLALLFNKKIDLTFKPVAFNAMDRYVSLFNSKLQFYNSAGSFVDLSKGYYVSFEFRRKGDSEKDYVSYCNLHFGFDLSREGGSAGDTILAGLSGIITKTNWNTINNGYDMQIEYGYQFENSFIGTGIFGEYMHMQDSPALLAGTFVNASDTIGLIGGTPLIDGKLKYTPHLHYDMLTQGGNYSATTLAMLLGNNAFITSFTSNNGANRVYNPILYYKNLIGKNIVTKSEYLALKNK
ncbi:MAG: M23 family metallopeptidase, partial [Treponema sp.]|nr:M23 family metallopeptidase [Treponema sp.]